MHRYWFKPKRYGFGATPASWEGWIVSAAAVLAVLAEGKLIPGHARAGSGLALLAQLATAGAFAALCWMKTEGGWRWRWGNDG